MKLPIKTRLDVPTVIFTVSIIIALSFILGLSRQNARLAKRNAELSLELETLAGTISGSPAARAGDIVPPFEAIDLDGNKVVVAYGQSSRYLFYIFSPGCGACISQFPVWNHLATQAQTRNWVPLGVTIKSGEFTKNILEGSERNFKVLIMPNEAIQRSYRVVAEPVVMLISADGVVDWVHYGTLAEVDVSQILSRIEAGK